MNIKMCVDKMLYSMKKNGMLAIENKDEYKQVMKSSFSNLKEKKDCNVLLNKIKKGNGSRDIYNYLNSQIEQYHYSADKYQTKKEQPNKNIEQEQSIWSIIGWTILFLVLSYIFLKTIRYLASLLYDVLNKHRMVYLKVILPRLDTKLDREREKDVAKDMKEKIGRMAQVFRGIHKPGNLSVMDNIMRILFDKAKFDLIYQYKEGKLSFIVGTYPEYQKMIESNISAQYDNAVLEPLNHFRIFNKNKINEIMPLSTKKKSVFPIRTFKQLEDDPINNILNTISKISNEDELTILMTLRPYKDKFNNQAKKIADKLFKREITYEQKFKFSSLIKPINFLISGPSDKMVKSMKPGATSGDSYTRMTKAEEEAINTMADEAGKPAFGCNIYLISNSEYEDRNDENIQSLISSYTIYRDEYNNYLDQPEWLADLFGFIFKPLRRFAALFSLVAFFTKRNIFTINELTSLYHLPDGIFNRAPGIVRADYKMTEPPKALPVPKDENGKIMTGIVAEGYKGGKIPNIFEGVKHTNIGTKMIEKVVKDKDTGEEKIVEKNTTGIKLYKDAILLGLSVYKNQYKPVYIKRNDRTRHHYIIGKSGGGKSVYISSLARQDIWNGDGVCVIDPHGDLVEDIINYVPKERAKDIIYFDAGNAERPMGLNLYEIDKPEQADRVVNDATEIFIKMFGAEIFGPRIQEYFKYGSLTLLEDMEEGATLLDVPRLFTDDGYREYKTAKVKNPTVRNFWEKTYNAMGDREKQEIIPYFTSKFVSFNTNGLIRNIIGQTKSAFKFREAMDSRKIILINLSKGRIGELNAQLLGMIIVSQIYNAAMSRADIPEKERKDFYLYVDEFQNFVSGTFADILSEARKYRLALIMAHQYIAQLEGDKKEGGKNSVKDAVFGNTGTLQSFKVGAPDAEFLEKEYTPVLSAQDIIGIANYKAYLKLNIDNATSRVFNISTIWTQDYQNEKVGSILKEYSAKKYGRDVKFVNEEIIARLGFATDDEEDDEDDNNENES